MILLHAIKMTMQIRKGQQIVDREEVSLFTKKTKLEAVQDLAQLQNLHKALGKRIQYHLLHVSDLGPFNDIEHELFTLNCIDLNSQIYRFQQEVDNKE